MMMMLVVDDDDDDDDDNCDELSMLERFSVGYVGRGWAHIKEITFRSRKKKKKKGEVNNLCTQNIHYTQANDTLTLARDERNKHTIKLKANIQ